MISEETRDDGVDCPDPDEAVPILSIATYRIWLWAFEVLFQYSPYWIGAGWYGGTVDNDPALAWGVDYYPEPLTYAIAYASSSYGAITGATSTTIEWTIDWEYYDTHSGTGLNELHAVGSAYIVP